MSDNPDTQPDIPLPPANFLFLVQSIMLQTQLQLGLSSSSEEAREPNLVVASHSIDLLAMLQEKTRGRLTTEEKRTLDNGLTELRFRLAQVSQTA